MNVYCPEGLSTSTIRTGSIVVDLDSRTASVEGQTLGAAQRSEGHCPDQTDAP